MPLVGAAAALVAVFGPAAPTGWTPLDALLRAGLVALVVTGAAASSRWRATWAATLASFAVLVGSADAAPAATVALGGMLALVATGRSDRFVQALAAAGASIVLLDVDWEVAAGASAALAFVALAPLVAAGFAVAYKANATAVRATVASAVVVGTVGAATGLAAALLAKPDVDRGVRTARDGLAALERDDRGVATDALTDAAASFDDAEAILRAPWARAAYAVPIVAQQIRAVSTLASSGSALASTAVTTIEQADPSSVRPIGGRVDLDAVRRLRGPLEEVDEVVSRSQRQLRATASPWLLPPVADRHVELGSRLDRTAGQTSVAARAVRVAPALLGADGTRRYLIAVYTPAESRGGGGFMGNYGELTAQDGKLTLAHFGRIAELTKGGADPAGRTIRGHDDYVANWGNLNPDQYWGVINLTNDFPTAASVMRQLYPQSGGQPVDGVVAVDPDAFAAFLRLTGPLAVDGWAEPLTAENARQILLHDQYLSFGAEDRVDFLGDASRRLFDQLTTGELPGVGLIAESLGPVVRGRHLQLESADAEEQALFTAMGATGAVPPLVGDSIGFTGQNYNGNKIDWYLHRTATYDVDWDPATGGVDSTLTLELRNDAPATGEPHAVIGWGGDEILNQIPVADGENLMLLSVYSAFPLQDLAVDGAEVKGIQSREHDRYATRFYVRVPPRSNVVATVRFAGVLERRGDYRLDVMHQPMVNADQLDVAVRVKGDAPIDAVSGGLSLSENKWAASRFLDGPVTVSIRACRLSHLLLERARGGC